jgi:hypothetical protein
MAAISAAFPPMEGLDSKACLEILQTQSLTGPDRIRAIWGSKWLYRRPFWAAFPARGKQHLGTLEVEAAFGRL